MSTRVTLSDVKASNPTWFATGNKRFFNDIDYRILQGRETKQPYLIQHTYGFSDMFGKPKRAHYRIRPINDDLSLGSLQDQEFADLDNVKEWLIDL